MDKQKYDTLAKFAFNSRSAPRYLLAIAGCADFPDKPWSPEEYNTIPEVGRSPLLVPEHTNAGAVIQKAIELSDARKRVIDVISNPRKFE